MDVKVIIAGGRDFNNFSLLKKKLDNILSNFNKQTDNIIIISGTAKGADSLGEKYAKINNFKLEQHPANWSLYGKSAGYIRNAEMAKSATISDKGCLVAFWDGKSRGTKSMIDIAKKQQLTIRIIKY